MRYKLYKYTNEIAKYATLIRFLLCLDMKFAQKRMEMCLNLSCCHAVRLFALIFRKINFEKNLINLGYKDGFG